MKLTKLSIFAIIIMGIGIISCGTPAQKTSQQKDNKVADGVKKEVATQSADTKDEVKVLIKTTAGDMTVKLYNETPLHKANFIKLVNDKFYDGVLFHRVIKDFMIQAGDPDSKNATKDQMLGSGGPGYTIDAEFNPKFIHKKGALAAARQGDNVNPQKKSSGSQFYIVQGKKYTVDELQQLEIQMEMQSYMPLIRQYLDANQKDRERVQKMQSERNQKGLGILIDSITRVIKEQHPEIKANKYTAEQIKIYETIGGTPFLDRSYTVFGEVVDGLNIIDKIAAVETKAQDRPSEDVKIISMQIVKK